MVKWEYHCADAVSAITAQTNSLGKDGWELVTSYPWRNDIILVFKRQIPLGGNFSFIPFERSKKETIDLGGFLEWCLEDNRILLDLNKKGFWYLYRSGGTPCSAEKLYDIYKSSK